MNHKRVILRESEPENFFYQEAVKTLRANIQFAGKSNKVILLTSCLRNEGKSSSAFQLAKELGKDGERVLLIDADIRASVLAQQYGLADKVNGLTHFLSGQINDINEIIYKTNFDNLYIIFSGPYSMNAPEMLNEESFGKFIRVARDVFDYIIIDTAPLGEVIDAAIVGKNCDSALLVLEAGAISYKLAQKVKWQLENGGCPVLGVVLNKVQSRDGKHVYYGKKYGKYGKYRYGYDEHGKKGKRS